MAFPQTRLPIAVELQVNGTWTDISTDVRTQGGTDAIKITRGITASGGKIADAATCSMTLDNNNGNYSSHNPTSPYYPYLGRNTPIRVGVPFGTPWLDCPYGVANTASTPDAAVLDVTGDIDVRVDAELAAWEESGESGASNELIGKYNLTGNQRSWVLSLSSAGTLRLVWYADGTDATFSFAESAPVGAPPGSRLSVRATLDVNNGASGNTATFYTSTTTGTSGPWTQLGNPVVTAGVTSIFNSTATLNVGDIPTLVSGNPARKIYKAEVRNGLAGTIVANPDFGAQTVGATSFADTAPSARTWTVTAGAITNVLRRFSGEVSEWPPQWDAGGKDVTTPIAASGALQRYNQSKTVLQSTLRRSIPSDPNLLAYWPMEDGATATQGASPMAGVSPMRVSGFTWAADSTLVSSAPLPQLAPPSTMTAKLPTTAVGDWGVECVVKLDTLPASPQLMLQVNSVGGTATTIQFLVGVAVARLQTVDSSGAVTNTVDVTPTNFTTDWLHFQISTVTVGGTVNLVAQWSLLTHRNSSGGTDFFNAPLSFSGTPGRVASVTGTWGTNFADLRLGHLAVFAESTTAAYDNAGAGYDGESAATRIGRVAAEQGAPVSVASSDGDTQLLGPQAQDTFLNILSSAAQADEGLLYEAREFLGLRYRGLASLYNQPSALDLPYVATPQALMAPLIPVEDLQGVVNDSTVTRTNGSFGHSVIVTGPLSTLPPPAGIGSGYDEDVTLNLHTDDQTPLHAGWRTHVGTWDEARFPQVNLSLEKNPALIPAACRIDTGSRMRITPPLIKQLPPDAIDQLVLGYEENLSQFSWRFAFACQPYGPYKVAIADDAVQGRADTDGSQLGTGITSTATSMQIATTSGPLWSTDPAQYPQDIRMGGETITVTAVSGASSPQTATITRSINTVAKAQTAGTAITVATAAIAAL